MSKKFGERLQKARELRGLEARTMAERAGIAYSTYKNHENGRGGERDALKYATILKVNYIWLAKGVGKHDDKPVQQVFDSLPGDKQEQVLDFLDFLQKGSKRA